MELVARFPPSEVENLAVWRHILLRALSQDVRLRVKLDIIELAQKVLTDWKNGGYRLGQVIKVVRATSDVGCIMTVVIPCIGGVLSFHKPVDLQTQYNLFVCPECTAVGPPSSGSGLLSP